MASQNDQGFRTFLASGAISAYLVVDVQSDGTVAPVTTTGSAGVGVIQEDAPDGRYGRVKLWTGPGTFMIMVTGTAITPGNSYQIISGGFIGASAGGVTAGKALQAGVASNGIILEFAGLL